MRAARSLWSGARLAMVIAGATAVLGGSAAADSLKIDNSLPSLARVQIEQTAAVSRVGQRPVFEAAPTPNVDLVAPSGFGQSERPRVAPVLFSSHTNYRGDGYTPGSNPQTTSQPRHMPFPGISVKVPLN